MLAQEFDRVRVHRGRGLSQSEFSIHYSHPDRTQDGKRADTTAAGQAHRFAF